MVCLPVCQPTSQSVIQSLSQPFGKFVSQLVGFVVCQSISHQSVSWSAFYLATLSVVGLSFSLLVSQSVGQPFSNLVSSWSIFQPVSQSVSQSVIQSVDQQCCISLSAVGFSFSQLLSYLATLLVYLSLS